MPHPMSEPWVDWRPIETAPLDRDFLVAMKSGYITRGRLINGKFLAIDSTGPVSSGTDTTASHWAEIPAGPQ